MEPETMLLLRDLIATVFFATVGAVGTAVGLWWWGRRKVKRAHRGEWVK